MEKLRAHTKMWTAGDEADMPLLDPDVVFEDNVLPDHGGEEYRGHEGVARAVRASSGCRNEWLSE